MSVRQLIVPLSTLDAIRGWFIKGEVSSIDGGDDMITYITDEVAIGNSQDSTHADNKQFDAVLNVAIDFDIMDGFKWRHKVGLLDGPGNDPLMFASAVILLHSLVRRGKKVLVHCHEGKSRSVMVVAAWMWARGYEFDATLEQIMKVRGVDQYRPALRELAVSTHALVKSAIG
jgi:protein-tyrosine phosphatase